MCDVCSAVFKNKHALSGHKRKVHAEKVMVTCPDCFQVTFISVECSQCLVLCHDSLCRCSTLITNFTITGTRCTTYKTVGASSVEGLTRTKSCCRFTRESRTRTSMRLPKPPSTCRRSKSTQLPTWLHQKRSRLSPSLVLVPNLCCRPTLCHCFPTFPSTNNSSMVLKISNKIDLELSELFVVHC